MKVLRIIITLSLVAIINCSGQIFNGTITYENTDTGKMNEVFLKYVPSKMFTAISGNNVAQWFDGGMFGLCKYMFLDKKPELYIVVDSLKVFTKIGVEKNVSKIFEKENEVIDILGHSCTKYKIILNTESGTHTSYSWIAEYIKVPVSALLQLYGNDLFILQLPYAVLKFQTQEGLIYQATKISTDIPSPSLFKLPKGYKEDKKLFRKVDAKEKKKN